MTVGICNVVKVYVNGETPICGSPPPSEIPLGANMMLIGGFTAPYLRAYDIRANPFTELSVLPASLDNQVEAIEVSPIQDIAIVGGGRSASDKPYVFDISVRPWIDITDTVLPAAWPYGITKRIIFGMNGDRVCMATTNGEVQVFDRSAGDDTAWVQQADSGFDNGNIINDEVDMSVKGEYLAIGKRAFYGAGATTNPHIEIYDVTTDPIRLLTEIIWQERSFNSNADNTGVSFHPTLDFITGATQLDNGIRSGVASYTEGPLAFTELDNFVTPEPSLNSMGACRFSPDGRFVAYGAASASYLQMYEATAANDNPVVSFDQSNINSSVREIIFSRNSRYMAVGMSGGNVLALYDTSGATPVVFANPTNVESSQINTIAFSS